MICTRVAPSTLAQESHPIRCRSPPRRESRSPQSRSQRASFYGPVAQEEVLRSWPLVQRNRDQCLHPLLCPNQLRRNRSLFHHPSLRCQMARALIHVQPQRAQHAHHHHHHLRRRKRVPQHRPNRRSLGTRHCTTSRVKVLVS